MPSITPLILVLASLASLAPSTQAETVLGVYIFHRHGDRTSKSFAPTTLTNLGYQQVYSSGEFYRARYIESNASSPIYGVSPDVVKNSQLSVQAPVDTVLQTSAASFLQALYPPVGNTETLANGTRIESGLQFIPVSAVATAASGTDSENNVWLQGQSNCQNAILSSNSYFYSQEYLDKLSSTAGFYKSILPVINGTFTAETDTFKNAYGIYDLVHVSTIHNSSIPSSDLLTDEALFQLRTLADDHEYKLAFNASEPIRAISGSTLAAQIVQDLNSTIVGKSKAPISIEFGAYASFFSFFGLAQLPKASENFTGLVDYASSMVFELVTNATVSKTSYPSNDQISVRFLFSNGTAAGNPLTPYPLFGGDQSSTLIPWTGFVDGMNKFAIGDQVHWCNACGNSTGVCASAADSTASSTSSKSSPSSSGGVSKVVAGVIGALVTLAVVFGLEALIMLVGGLRLVNKKRLSGHGTPENAGAASVATKA
ncbi:Uncharacterized protein BP5553_05969 [Venustampulla echinocandica]|uniref:Phosphoglycerate mutase-like protein n=1 Tax=Venustampulla echinocandica TaxID=2656787 RepID=A0A370TM66_9HELO|nr:Uncharacterized protein BP5553_05969 [Venustampulla echinocandica]RDL36617.1 Uncharacterized protein BP5553_05969 [Venustampulla echinocandica]